MQWGEAIRERAVSSHKADRHEISTEGKHTDGDDPQGGEPVEGLDVMLERSVSKSTESVLTSSLRDTVSHRAQCSVRELVEFIPHHIRAGATSVMLTLLNPVRPLMKLRIHWGQAMRAEVG